MKDLPMVSIIVPGFNAEKNIAYLIESLLNLNYPKELLEIIIVDNNSIDDTREIIKRYPVILLEETEIQSSYAARNRGIRKAKGDIVAFTDSDCIVMPQWVREGVETLHNENADLAGGKVEFVFSNQKTCAEIYDSIVNMNNELSIREQKVAKTANLFVKANLFMKIGVFYDNIISGGDVCWTRKATQQGFKLVYAKKAIVKHPSRLLKDLLIKQYRVGTGKISIWREEGGVLKGFRYWLLRKKLNEQKASNIKTMNFSNTKLLGIIFVKIACKIASILGTYATLLNNIKIKNKK